MKRKIVTTCVASIWVCFAAFAQNTIGLISHTSNSLDSGYVLFAPTSSTTTYLIDKCGKEIHSWADSYKPGQSVYLAEDSSIYVTGVDPTNTTFVSGGGQGGWIQKRSWNNQLLWSYKISDSLQCQHHDIAVMPNGDVLAIAWEKKSHAEAIAAGRDTAKLDSNMWSGKIVELKPIGTDSAQIVWEWHAWDHLVQDFDSTKANYGNVAAHPELIDLNHLLNNNRVIPDWLHINSVTYNAQFDQIMLSVHNFCEVWIIDHSTTTAEAASHSGGHYGKGGDLLYRWGNPQAYGQGAASDRHLFGQHDATWIPAGYPDAGDIMVFNNGVQRPGYWPSTKYSSVDIFKPAVDSAGNYDTSSVPYLPSSITWDYTDSVPTNFFSQNMGGAQMLSNGNVLICSAQSGDFFEVDSLGNKVWEYINPVDAAGPEPQGSNPTSNQVFRCTFYPYSYPAFANKSLPQGPPIETNPSNYPCNLNVSSPTGIAVAPVPTRLFLYPNPADNTIQITGLRMGTRVQIFNAMGALVSQVNYSGSINISGLDNGIYFLTATNEYQVFKHKFLIMR